MASSPASTQISAKPSVFRRSAQSSSSPDSRPPSLAPTPKSRCKASRSLKSTVLVVERRVISVGAQSYLRRARRPRLHLQCQGTVDTSPGNSAQISPVFLCPGTPRWQLALLSSQLSLSALLLRRRLQAPLRSQLRLHAWRFRSAEGSREQGRRAEGDGPTARPTCRYHHITTTGSHPGLHWLFTWPRCWHRQQIRIADAEGHAHRS